MSSKQATILIIAISIIFAVTIVISSTLLAGTGYSQTVIFVLIAIWWVPFTYLIIARNRKSDR